MCFSATASFVSGGLIGIVGGATLTQVRKARELVFASLPLLFAVHQIEEGFVWLTLEHRMPTDVGWWSKWLYIIYAHALLPTLSPLGILLIERTRWRRAVMLVLLLLGLAITSYVCWTFTRYPIKYEIVHHSVVYRDGISGSGFFSTLYVIATCVPLLLSGYGWIALFGVLNLVALIATSLVKKLAFTSVWCAVAAMISVFIYLHFRRERRRERLTNAGGSLS